MEFKDIQNLIDKGNSEMLKRIMTIKSSVSRTKAIARTQSSSERVNAAATKMDELKNKYDKPINNSVVEKAAAKMEEISKRHAPPKKEKVITKIDNPIVTSAAAKMAEIANRTKK